VSVLVVRHGTEYVGGTSDSEAHTKRHATITRLRFRLSCLGTLNVLSTVTTNIQEIQVSELVQTLHTHPYFMISLLFFAKVKFCGSRSALRAVDRHLLHIINYTHVHAIPPPVPK